MLLSFACFFLLFGQNPSLYIRERERERERLKYYTQYNFCEHKEVDPMLYFLGSLRGDNGHAWPGQLEAKEFKANPIGVLLWGQDFGSFLLNESFRFWIHWFKVWIYMSSGFWVLDCGWVVGLGLFGRIWATDFGFEVGLVIIHIRSD